MYLTSNLLDTKANAPQEAKRRDSAFEKKEVLTMSKRKLFLVGIIVVLAALLVVQAGGSRTEAGTTASEASPTDSPPLKVDPAASTMSRDVQGAGQFPSPQSLFDTSPYAKEGLKISSGAAGINLPE